MSNYPMVGQCFVKLFNGRTVLCSTVQWLDSAVSNCSMIRHNDDDTDDDDDDDDDANDDDEIKSIVAKFCQI